MDTRQSLASLLAVCGSPLLSASTVRKAEFILKNTRVSVVVCSEELADGSFHEILGLCRTHLGKLPVIVFSPLADWQRYLQIIHAGAFDYARFPGTPGEIERIVRQALSCGLRMWAAGAASAA